jgi:nicotinate-nucleotide adenylyltransferase
MKLGVLGGTFDPIHCGHMHIARYAHRLFELAEIHFVVATSPPHKPAQDLGAFSLRFAMVSLATLGQPAFIPSLIELQHPRSPFSIHTLAKLAQKNSRDPRDLYFIAGGDSLLEVSKWRDSRKLLSTYSFIFVSRPGVDEPDPSLVLPREAVSRVRDLRGMGPRRLRREIHQEERVSQNRIYLLDVSAPDISASRIRALAARGKRIRELVPAPVHQYIGKLHLYGD